MVSTGVVRFISAAEIREVSLQKPYNTNWRGITRRVDNRLAFSRI